MDTDTKKKVIRLHKRNISNKEIAERLNLKEPAVSKCITSYNSVGSDFYKSKPGNPKGELRSMSPEQVAEFENWLLSQKRLLTTAEIRTAWEHVTGDSISSQTINDYLNRFFRSGTRKRIKVLRKRNANCKDKILYITGGRYRNIKILASMGSRKYTYYYFIKYHTLSTTWNFFSLLDSSIPLPSKYFDIGNDVEIPTDIIYVVDPTLEGDFQSNDFKWYFDYRNHNGRMVLSTQKENRIIYPKEEH